MPTDTKKVALNRISRGRISPSACWLKRLSLTSRPARKAPRERLTPARLVRYAVPKHTAMTVRRKSSGEQVRATTSRSRGMSRRATEQHEGDDGRRLAERPAGCRPRSPPVPPSMGTSSTITMMARSWKMSRPRPTWPWACSVSPRSPSSFSTIAVELKETRKPVKSPSFQGTPKRARRPTVAGAGQHHLEPAPAEDQPLDARELLQAELDADGEEQQDDAHLGGGVHEGAVLHEAEAVGADHHSGDQEAGDGHEAEAVADVGDGRPRHEEGHHLGQEGGHGRGREGLGHHCGRAVAGKTTNDEGA